MMNRWLIYGVIIAVGAGIYYNTSNKGSTPKDSLVVSDVDLKRALDITLSTIENVDAKSPKYDGDPKAGDEMFVLLAKELSKSYSSATPKLDKKTSGMIGVQPLNDGSLMAFQDNNKNGKWDSDPENEDAIFQIEIDGRNSRIIATSRIGEVNQAGFSGSGFLAGMLIGNMLNRQSSAGKTQAVSNKKPVTAQQARSRAGSGSYRRGK
jgi:hypothetical protein